jgi:hypothetical protein
MELTPQEQNIVKYHRVTMDTKRVGKDKDGRPVTVYSTGVKIPKGDPNAGKFVAIPGYNRDTGTIMSEMEAYNYWRDDVISGKWPMYDSGSELNKRSKQIHKIMDDEAGRARKGFRE